MSRREELAWAAGLFDGEGSASNNRRTATTSSIKLSVGQKDRRVLDRFHAAVGVGTVYGPRAGMYYYQAHSLESVQAVVAMLWQWLSPVKRGQISDAFSLSARARSTYAERMTRCPQGHDFTPENTRVHVWNGKRSRNCRECARVRHQKRRLAWALLVA